MNGLLKIVVLNFRLEFPKNDLTINLSSGIFNISLEQNLISAPQLLDVDVGDIKADVALNTS